MYRLLGWVMVHGMVTVLASPAGAQSSDTLSLQPIPAIRIATIAEDSMPASHRSAQDDVDRPVEITYCPAPKYPIALAEYGFAGFVQLQYVVDTLGRPEVGDMRVLEASNQGFVPSALRAVAKCRFIPAQKAGRPARQLVKQRVVFRQQSAP
jgi:TonB family protein